MNIRKIRLSKKRGFFLLDFLMLFGVLGIGSATEKNRSLVFDLTLNAPVEKVWEAWTTEAGIKSFFAPGCNIDLRVDGFYEIFFFPDAQPGQRGAEGMRVMAIEPDKLFSFTWNQPPNLPAIRDQRTLVTLKFEAIEGDKTKLIFIQTGWGDGADWDKAIEYFTVAWGDVVLFRLQHLFGQGPIDWSNPPRREK